MVIKRADASNWSSSWLAYLTKSISIINLIGLFDRSFLQTIGHLIQPVSDLFHSSSSFLGGGGGGVRGGGGVGGGGEVLFGS